MCGGNGKGKVWNIESYPFTSWQVCKVLKTLVMSIHLYDQGNTIGFLIELLYFLL